MTDWLQAPDAGRPRGPRGIGRAWLEVIVRPNRFFRTAVVPGDQGPGLTFAMTVVLVEEATRLAFVPEAVPPLVGGRLVATVLVLGLATLLVAPLGLHLVAAIQTLLLRPLVADRAPVSETVQVLAYAAAPCALAGLPVPALRVVGTAYGAWLLVIGLATVHGIPRRRAAVAGVIPAAVVFGYGFRGFDAVGQLLAAWYII